MRGIQKQTEIFLDSCAGDIIRKLDDKFDSHDFIKKLIKYREHGYIARLSGYATFKNFHSQIGRYLKENSCILNIKSDGKNRSINIKGYNSENEKWKKVN